MSGSILSLLSNSDNAFCNRELYGCHQQVNRENSYKELKNQSNFERQNMETSITDGFLAFSRDLQRPYQPRNVTQHMNNFGFSVERRMAMPYVPKKVVSRDPSTSPKIVGVERKKHVNYQPVYMQRHSIALGNGLANMADLQEQNYQRNKILNQSKRISIGEPIVTPPAPQEVKPQEATRDVFSVKDRISFFNKLATNNGHRNEQPKPKETFLSLLRQKEPKTSIIRLSQLIETASVTKSPSKIPSKEGSSTLNTSGSKCSTHVFRLGTHSLPTQLKRKPSFEKTKVVSSSIAKISTNFGTNPRRHCLMEDLSMVVPVKLRIAEFEKRIVNM